MVNDIPDQLAHGRDQQGGLLEARRQGRLVRVDLEASEGFFLLQTRTRNQAAPTIRREPLARLGGKRGEQRLERTSIQPSALPETLEVNAGLEVGQLDGRAGGSRSEDLAIKPRHHAALMGAAQAVDHAIVEWRREQIRLQA
jgi:hypothetical protein